MIRMLSALFGICELPFTLELVELAVLPRVRHKVHVRHGLLGEALQFVQEFALRDVFFLKPCNLHQRINDVVRRAVTVERIEHHFQ